MKIFRDIAVTFSRSYNSKIPKKICSNFLEKHHNFKCSQFWKTSL